MKNIAILTDSHEQLKFYADLR